MNIQIFAEDTELIRPLKSLCLKKGGFIHINSDIESFFKSAIQNPSNLYLIQLKQNNLASTLDMIRDLRIYFGAFPLIVVLAREKDLVDISTFLNIGADNLFKFPFDLGPIEDFIGANLYRESFLSFKYRHVPSGGAQSKLNLNIKLQEIRTNGIIFQSKALLTRGSLIDFSIKKYLDVEPEFMKCKIVTIESSFYKFESEDNFFTYFAAFHEFPKELLTQIRYLIKNSK